VNRYGNVAGQQPGRPVGDSWRSWDEHMLGCPGAFPPSLWTENIVPPPSLGSLIVELHLLIWNQKVVLPGVPVILLNLYEHPPWHPSHSLERGRPKSPRAVQEDVGTDGSIRSPVPGKRERFTSTRCCGCNQRNGTDGESRQTRSKETEVRDGSTVSRRRRSQYALSAG
jgi:hypothetical protein